jgi:hypothetical protein
VHACDGVGCEFPDPQGKNVTTGAGPLPPPNRQEGKMFARNDVKRPFHRKPNARRVLAAARRRFAAWVDVRVARWLERCARNVEAAQRLFPDQMSARESGMERELSRFIPTLG